MSAVHEVRGGRELRRTLRGAGDDLSDLKDVHKQAAAIAATRAKADAPEVSGRLAATIRSSGTKTAGIVRVGNNTKVPYAHPIHWGWAARGIPANPFAARGAQESEPVWVALYVRYVDDTLDKIKGA